jgi:hypothetical protein
VYRAELPELGGVAIKELRNPSLARRAWFGWLAEHPGLHEYRIGVEFEARGGRTLRCLGGATEHGPFGLERVLLFTRWLEGADTLTRWLAGRARKADARLIGSLAAQVAAAARLGLVHHRHSSNNLLVVMQGDEPLLYTIDFAYATLGDGLDAAGLARDAARIARWLLREAIWPREAALVFFDAVAAQVHAERAGREQLALRMRADLEAVIQDPSARRPARA